MGTETCSFVTLAVLSSLGTRNAISTSLPPFGAVVGSDRDVGPRR